MTRPQSLCGHTIRVKTGCGKLYITISTSDSYEEIFCKLGKSGGCAAAFLDGIGRVITHALNVETVTKETIIKSFLGIQCPSPMWSDGEQVLSCLDGIAKVLRKETKEEEKEDES